jgi:hypothetical protein
MKEFIEKDIVEPAGSGEETTFVSVTIEAFVVEEPAH